MKFSTPDIQYDPMAGRPDRTAGLHLTNLLDHLASKLHLNRNTNGYGDWENAAGAGFVWEDAVAEALSRQQLSQDGLPIAFMRGFEGVQDGILYTPDGIDTERWEVWDFKLTWKSVTSTPPQENWKWVMQMKSYCYCIGSLSAVLFPLYVCGKYRPLPAPVLAPTRLTFTQEELDEHWNMILETKRDYLKSKG